MWTIGSGHGVYLSGLHRPLYRPIRRRGRLGQGMRFDIDRLQTFYGSSLGRMAHDMVAKRVGALWPHADGLDVLGIGHADALLERYRAGARRVISAAPDEQGAERWPAEARGLATLVEDERLPFPDALFDRIIVCHALEEAESPHRLLREIWRVRRRKPGF